MILLLTLPGESTVGQGFQLILKVVETFFRSKWIVFDRLDGPSGIADDMFIYSMGEAQHDRCVFNILDTARESNVRFNLDKISIQGKRSILFCTYWTPEGIRSYKNNIKAICDMPPQKNLQSCILSWA